MTKHARIAPDYEQLDALVRLVPAERRPIADRLAAEIAFMQKTLDQLKREVDERGVVDFYQNGKQSFLRESPALRAYNTTIQRYSLIYKQLAELLPKQNPNGAPGGLMDFLKQG